MTDNHFMLFLNTVRILIFAALAMFFHIWWLVLFAGLFLAYRNEK